MKRHILALIVMLLGLLPAQGQYQDHRNYSLDSLEQVVAPWTAERIASASPAQRDMLDDAFNELMWGYLNINPSRSMHFARKSLSLAREEKKLSRCFAAARILGMHYDMDGQVDSARVWFDVALSFVDEMAKKEPLPGKPDGYRDETIDDCYSSLYGAMGNMYARLDSIPVAMHFYNKAGEIFRKHNWVESSSVLYHNMGEIWLDEGNLKESEKCYRTALAFGQEASDSLLVAEASSGLGALYLEEGKTTQALSYLLDADRYFSGHEDQEYRDRIYTLDIMGKVYKAQKRQRSVLAAVATLSTILLLVLAFVLARMLRTQRELRGADAVIGEVVRESENSEKKEGTAQPKAVSPHGELPTLTDREKEILPLMAMGLTNKEIAGRLFLSEQTVKWYKMRLNSKLDTSSSTEAVARAKDLGII